MTYVITGSSLTLYVSVHLHISKGVGGITGAFNHNEKEVFSVLA
ncbi:MAG: hypothetical protein ACXVI1_10150 [Halobacteriota archaeon]